MKSEVTSAEYVRTPQFRGEYDGRLRILRKRAYMQMELNCMDLHVVESRTIVSEFPPAFYAGAKVGKFPVFIMYSVLTHGVVAKFEPYCSDRRKFNNITARRGG